MGRRMFVAPVAVVVGVLAAGVLTGPASAVDDNGSPTSSGTATWTGDVTEPSSSRVIGTEPADPASSRSPVGNRVWAFDEDVVRIEVAAGEDGSGAVTLKPTEATERGQEPVRGPIHVTTEHRPLDESVLSDVGVVEVSPASCDLTPDTSCTVTLRLSGLSRGEASGTVVALDDKGREIATARTVLIVLAPGSGPAGGGGSSASGSGEPTPERTDGTTPASYSAPPPWLVPLVVVLGALVVGAMGLGRMLRREPDPPEDRPTLHLRAGATDAVVLGRDGPVVVVQARLRRTGRESIGG